MGYNGLTRGVSVIFEITSHSVHHILLGFQEVLPPLLLV